jgi:hypothetical protein
MAHLKCLACTTRLYSTEAEAEPIGDLCPVCGSLLAPIGYLGEVVGRRVIEPLGSTPHSGASGGGPADRPRRGDHRSTQARTNPA